MSEAIAATQASRPYRWVSAHATHKGNVRKVNEDAVLACPERGLWAVADGMGGHEAGDYASAAIVDALARVEAPGDLAARVDAVEDTLLDVNDALRRYAKARFNGETVGSTVVAMMTLDTLGVVLWAGDSRLYRLRAGELEQITRDHNPIADLLDAGAVSEEEAMNANTNIVTRAVGGQGPLHLDIVVFDVEPNDRFVLCTDGLYRELAGDELAACLRLDVSAASERALRSCLAGAAQDNVSFVFAHPREAPQS